MDAESLVRALNFNTRALSLNLEGLTHEDTLAQPPDGNCIHWLLGHILVHRSLMLEALGEAPVGDPAALARYRRGSEPVRGGEEGLEPLERLREELERSRERLQGALERASQDLLSTPGESGAPGQRLLFLALHEAYHVGQVGLLRRIVGREGAIR